MLILIPADELGAAVTGVRQLSQVSKDKANNLPFVSGLLAEGATHSWDGPSCIS